MTHRCLISFAISLINACVAECLMIVRRVIHRINAFSSAIDRSCTDSFDCAIVLPPLICQSIVWGGISNAFAAWLGFCHCFLAISCSACCIRASRSALFLLLGRVIVVDNWKKFTVVIFDIPNYPIFHLTPTDSRPNSVQTIRIELHLTPKRFVWGL